MADKQSIQLLPFNFKERVFAYQPLAQGFNRSLSAFKSFVRKCHDPILKAGRCDQCFDDIGIPALTVEDELLQNIELVFQ